MKGRVEGAVRVEAGHDKITGPKHVADADCDNLSVLLKCNCSEAIVIGKVQGEKTFGRDAETQGIQISGGNRLNGSDPRPAEKNENDKNEPKASQILDALSLNQAPHQPSSSRTKIIFT